MRGWNKGKEEEMENREKRKRKKERVTMKRGRVGGSRTVKYYLKNRKKEEKYKKGMKKERERRGGGKHYLSEFWLTVSPTRFISIATSKLKISVNTSNH